MKYDYYFRKLPERYDETVRSRMKEQEWCWARHILFLEEVSKQVRQARKASVFQGTRTTVGERLTAEARKMTFFQRSVLGNFNSHMHQPYKFDHGVKYSTKLTWRPVRIIRAV